jgi:hypothetical protein
MVRQKSERLRKLESECQDLKQWLDLGLVPKKDLAIHEAEIKALEAKIEEEKQRLQALKDSGESEDYIIPRRSTAKASYQESALGSDLEIDNNSLTDAGLDTSYEGSNSYTLDGYETADDQTDVSEEDEDPFSDKNRWKRGMLGDPDNSQW